MSSTSWVTLATNDSYSLGALVLGNSLRNVGTAHQLTVLITPGVTNSMRDRLSTVFNNVKEVNVLDSRDKANLALLARPDLGITFTKLHCWRLTEFSKAVFMDADTLVLKNCDELFEREEFSAAPDAGWPDCFNSGVFVFKPSEETYQALLQFAVTHGSFDGGDQGLLNSYFSEWSTKDISRHLPFIYNMVSSAFYSYLPALKQYGDKVKIVHFIGPCKPWLQYLDCETKKVRAPPGSEHLQPLLQLWWDIFCSRVHSSLTAEMAGLAGALAQLTLGVPRTPEQIALDEHLRRQAWEEGRFDYMGADSFQNIWQKISETMAEKPESKDVHQEETPPVLPEQQSSIVSPEPREQVSAANAAVAIGQTSTAPQTPPSTDVHTTSFPPPVPSPTTQELTVEKPIPRSEHPAVAPPPGITPALSGLAAEQNVQTDPVSASKSVTQASVQGAESPAVAVLPPGTLSKSPVEAAAPALSQVEATPKESMQTLPSQILVSPIAPTTIPFTSQLPSAPIQTIAQPPAPSVKPESAPEKPPSKDISEQSPIVPVSAATMLASQPLTTPAQSVPLVPSAATPPTVPGSSPLTAPPVAPPIAVSSAPPLVPQPPTTPVQPVAESPSPLSPTTAAPSVEPVCSAPLSALPAAAPSSVPVLPAAPVSSPDHAESKMPPQPLIPAVSNDCKPSENAPVLEPFSEIAPPEVQLSEKSLEPTIVSETTSLQHTPESSISILPSQSSVPTIEGTVPPLVPTAPIVGVKPSPSTTVSTSKTDLPSPSLPAPAPPSTERTSESSTPLSAPTSPTDIQTRPMSTALVSVPKTKQKVPIRVPEPPKPPIPMPAPESPSALPSPPLLAGALASSETETAKTAVSVPALPKEPKAEGSTSQSPKQPEKHQETVKQGKDKGNLEELPATQLTEADIKLSKKAKDTEHGTDSQAAPEKISAKASTKQAKQSKPKAPETPTKSETTAAKPSSPSTTEPTSPEAEIAPQVTKVKTKVAKVPKGTKDPASKDVPQQDPVLKSVTPPVSSPVGSPPISPDAGKVAPIVEKSSAGAEKGTETSEQASVAPVPPKRKGAKATASGDGSSKTQSKPTKTAPKPKK